MKQDIESIKDIVKQVLSKDFKSRNNDKWLIIQVLKKMGYYVYFTEQQIDDMPSFESIRRARQKFQEQGFFPANESVKEMRGGEELQMKEIDKWFNL